MDIIGAEGTAESTSYIVTNNLDNDVTADCTVTLDSPLEGLVVSNGGITFTVGENTQAGEYTRTITASYTVDGDTFTDTATVTITVTAPL